MFCALIGSYLSPGQHHDAVGRQDGVESVGDGQRGAVLERVPDRLLDQEVRLRVHGGRGLIQNQHLDQNRPIRGQHTGRQRDNGSVSPCTASAELWPHTAAASPPPRSSLRSPPPPTPTSEEAETPEGRTGGQTGGQTD